MPAAATIIAEGQSVSASGVVEIAGLEPNTAYRLSAVALKGNINGKVSSIEHTTSAPGVHPAVVLTPGQSTTTTLTFNAALTDPETAAYVCLEKTEGLTLPTAEEILRDGKAIAQTGDILVENLKPSTTYVIAAAVANTGIYSEVNSIVMATGTPTPVVTLTAGATAPTTLTFTVGLADTEKAAYVCLEKADGTPVPTAEKILTDGTAIAQAGEITVDNLKDGTTYVIVENCLNGFQKPSLAAMLRNAAGEGPLAPQEPLFTGETAFPITALPAEDTGITETVDIVGNLCCAADVLAKNFTGPALAVGDLVAVGNTGAYARTLSPLLFSSHDVPAEFLI